MFSLISLSINLCAYLTEEIVDYFIFISFLKKYKTKCVVFLCCLWVFNWKEFIDSQNLCIFLLQMWSVYLTNAHILLKETHILLSNYFLFFLWNWFKLSMNYFIILENFLLYWKVFFFGSLIMLIMYFLLRQKGFVFEALLAK